MKYFIISIFAVVLVGCFKEPESIVEAGKDFKVQELFTHKGCTLYRFADGGGYIYYSDCRGNTSYQVKSGKASIQMETPTITKD